MRYWLDTEFIEDGKTIDLISIGIVAEDGRELYLCNSDCKLRRASQWVKDNVIRHLPPRYPIHEMSPRQRSESFWWRSRREIAGLVKLFLAVGAGTPEIWGYYADYDWVAVAQLYGTMMDLPPFFPMFCMDIKQWAVQLGNPDLPEQKSTEHHALADARWNKEAWEFLRAIAEKETP